MLGAATMARMNYFEWMFHPVARPGFLKADDVKLDASEMVLALDFNGDAARLSHSGDVLPPHRERCGGRRAIAATY